MLNHTTNWVILLSKCAPVRQWTSNLIFHRCHLACINRNCAHSVALIVDWNPHNAHRDFKWRNKTQQWGSPVPITVTQLKTNRLVRDKTLWNWMWVRIRIALAQKYIYWNNWNCSDYILCVLHLSEKWNRRVRLRQLAAPCKMLTLYTLLSHCRLKYYLVSNMCLRKSLNDPISQYFMNSWQLCF